MNRSFSLTLIALAALALSTTAAPDAPENNAVTLKPGDPAPKLQVGRWLKGEPVKEFEKGKVYVIECWATWCGPCIASMPHVTRLQEKFKDKGVVVIGVNVLEHEPQAVDAFLKKRGNRMGYAVATDDLAGAPADDDGEHGAMVTGWLAKASGQLGIPYSFIVDRDGKLAWSGHPMELERPLALVADGKFSLAEEAKFSEDMDKLNEAFGAALKAKENDKGLAILDEITLRNPTLAQQYGATKITVMIRKSDYAGANALAAKLAADPSLDETIVAPIASLLLNAPDSDKIDAPLALKLATKAYENNGKEGWQYEALLARAYAANKQFGKAVALETKVVEEAPPDAKEGEQKSLQEYTQKAAAKK
jgi:thiol-disulfide isomerase/thioredoxin